MAAHQSKISASSTDSKLQRKDRQCQCFTTAHRLPFGPCLCTAGHWPQAQSQSTRPRHRNDTYPTAGSHSHPILSGDAECQALTAHPPALISIINGNYAPNLMQHGPSSHVHPVSMQSKRGTEEIASCPCTSPGPPAVPVPSSLGLVRDQLCSPTPQISSFREQRSPDGRPWRGSPKAAGPALGHPLNTEPCLGEEGAVGRGDTAEQ